MIVATTPRLVLRDWQDADLPALTRIYADPEVMRHIGDGTVRSADETAAALARMRADRAQRGYGLYAVEERATGALAGWVGLAVPNFLPEILPAVEIGWRLDRSFWGRGYATEAAREVLRLAFDEYGLHRVVSICHVDNAASAKVMTKLGLTEERRTTVPAHGAPVRVFAIERDAPPTTPSTPTPAQTA